MSLLLILCGYLMGSIPFAYLAGRLIRGIDVREYGTRSVGASNVYEQVGRWLLVVVGLLDVGKAALPTWLALQLGLSLSTAVATGLAALIGHNWPLYLGFRGGRGLSACLGVLVVVFPWGALWELATLGMGRLLRHSTVNLVGLTALPLLAWALGEPLEVIASGAAMFLIVALKRLEANREPLPPGKARWQVLKRRLLLDRDIEDWDAWIARRPEGAAVSGTIAAGEHDEPSGVQLENGDTVPPQAD
jgi:glycerol-3-phosphate acyltransferase PlsY